MRRFFVLFAIAIFLVGCNPEEEPLPTTTSANPVTPPAVDGVQTTPTPSATPRPPLASASPQHGETGAGQVKDSEEPLDEWETGGPGEAPKPALGPAIRSKPQYLDRLETYSPFRQSPQLPDLSTQQPEVEPQLPDLYTLPPYDLRLVRDVSSGRSIVRFSNAIANLGPGALELRGRMDNSTGVVEVLQRIFTSTAEEDITYLESGVGQFHYHDIHEHWHWDGFSLYEVYSTLPDGSLGELIFSSDKVGYCLRDDSQVEELMDSNPSEFPTEARRYQTCGHTIQGLSAGWADIYVHNTPGQWVDVTGLAEGEIYALRSTTDPYNLIHEVDRNNNTAIVYFRLYGTRVELVESEQFVTPEEINE